METDESSNLVINGKSWTLRSQQRFNFIKSVYLGIISERGICELQCRKSDDLYRHRHTQVTFTPRLLLSEGDEILSDTVSK